MRMRDPSEKIHSQIRRPSFSGSLLTRIRRESLRGRRNTIWGPNVHFHAPAVFQIRKCFRHPVKIRSVGQTISFARRRRSGARGHSICCVEAGLYRGCLRVRPFKCSHSTTLTICSGRNVRSEECRRSAPGLQNCSISHNWHNTTILCTSYSEIYFPSR